VFLDASAIVAILAREPDAQRYIEAIERSLGSLIVSPLAVFEATTGLARAKSRGPPATADTINAARAVVLAFLEANSVRQTTVSPEIGLGALDAAGRFGGGRRPSRGSQFRRLFCLRLRQSASRAAAFQRRRFWANRCQ
jgi:ribonuclease VapC